MGCNTQNVKLGACFVKYDGVDLGLTKGGVEVEVSTETYDVTVDQFGETLVNSIIQKREVKVSVPLAETTLENLIRVMPGATMVDTGTKGVWTLDEAVAQNTTEYTVTIDGTAYSYTSDADATEDEILAGLADAINLSGQAPVTAVATAGVSLVLTAKVSGYTPTITVSGGTLASVNTTPPVAGVKRVDVSDAVNTDLLSLARELVLHPKALPFSNKSEDFIIPLAATAGAISFAYKHDEERVFNVEFMGYVDCGQSPAILFKFGDSSAS